MSDALFPSLWMNPLQVNSIISFVWKTIFDSWLGILFWISLAGFIVHFPFGAAVIAAFNCTTVALGLVYTLWNRSTERVVDWSKEFVVITGGSNGIGNDLALKLKNEGAKVVVLDLLPPQDKDLIYYECDLSVPLKMSEVANLIIKSHGHPTMLVNNAGIIIANNFVEQDLNKVDLLMNVNVRAVMHLTRLFLPGFISQNKGHILTVSSVMGFVGAANAVAYCASKFAVFGFCEALRQEMTGNVYVSSLHPGLIETGMFDGVVQKLQYIFPPLPPSIVGSQMFSILSQKRSQVACLPFFSTAGPLFQMLSVELKGYIARV